MAFLNATATEFPDSTRHGCLFHYTQAVWKQAVLRGLKARYTHEDDVRASVQYLLALPFVPLEDLVETMDLVLESIVEDDNVIALADYVDNVWVRGRPARGRRPQAAPRFGPSLWNVYELVMNQQQRTTNAVEGWHSRFLDHIKKDQKETEAMIIQLLSGHTRIRYPVKGKYTKNQEQVARIVARYQIYKNENDILTYLKAISYKLKLYAETEDSEPEP